MIFCVYKGLRKKENIVFSSSIRDECVDFIINELNICSHSLSMSDCQKIQESGLRISDISLLYVSIHLFNWKYHEVFDKSITAFLKLLK